MIPAPCLVRRAPSGRPAEIKGLDPVRVAGLVLWNTRVRAMERRV